MAITRFFVAVTPQFARISPHCEASITLLKLTCDDRFSPAKFDFNTRASILRKKNVLGLCDQVTRRAFDENCHWPSADHQQSAISPYPGGGRLADKRSILSASFWLRKFEVVERPGQQALAAIAADPEIKLVADRYHMGDMAGIN